MRAADPAAVLRRFLLLASHEYSEPGDRTVRPPPGMMPSPPDHDSIQLFMALPDPVSPRRKLVPGQYGVSLIGPLHSCANREADVAAIL